MAASPKSLFSLALALAGAVGGIYWLTATASYTTDALYDPVGLKMSEYSEAAILSLIVSFPFWLAVAAVAFRWRLRLRRPFYLLAISPFAVVFAALTTVFLVWPAVYLLVAGVQRLFLS